MLLIPISSYTVRFKDLDKLNLVKICNGGKVLGSSQFLILPQLPQKTMLASKEVKNNSKIVILLHLSKSVTHSVLLFCWVGLTQPEFTKQCFFLPKFQWVGRWPRLRKTLAGPRGNLPTVRTAEPRWTTGRRPWPSGRKRSTCSCWRNNINIS